jgi:hypothetical protein
MMRASEGICSAVIVQLLLILGAVNTKENTKGATVKTSPFESNEKVNGIQSSASSSSTPHNLHALEFGPKTLSVVRGEAPDTLQQSLKKYSSDSHRHPSRLLVDEKNYCEFSQEDIECVDLDGDCLVCDYESVKNNCTYGENVTIICNATHQVPCTGERSFKRQMVCQYCYQTPVWEQRCPGISNCNSFGSPRFIYKANCTVSPKVLCFGSRRFERMLPCNWKNGYRWSTTFILSVTLGGFGADRFYLGRWQEGIGKLFSFGGLGLWTIVDIILIGVRYLGPADGSLYVD